MAHVYCPECNWSQDDWWSEDYNPIKCLDHCAETLLTKPLDGDAFRDEAGDLHMMTWREVILEDLQRTARRINRMVYQTKADAQAAGWKCPKCGAGLLED